MSGDQRRAVRLLTGLHVGVVTDGVAARYAGRLAAQLGATVTRTDTDRREDSVLARWLAEGTTIVDDVLTTARPADVLIVGSDPETVDTWTRRWSETGHRATLVVLNWFDPDGPYAHLPGRDDVVYALSGIAYPFGPREGPPIVADGHLPQILGGVNALLAALGAVAAPPHTRSRRVDVSVLEAMIALAEPPASASRDGGGAPSRRLGINRFDPSYPTTSYRTTDGWVGVSCLTPPQWAGLAELIGRPELADVERYLTSRGRLAFADEIDALIAPYAARRTTDEIVASALTRRLPICPMPRPDELPHHPHWVMRQSFDAVPGRPDVLAPRAPYIVGPAPPIAPAGDGSTASADAPLAGVRVADFTMGWAGPYATRLLADLGADVVKVEHASHPDWWRGWDDERDADPPPTELQNHFNVMNRGKRSAGFDLGDHDGLHAARRLIAGADVVVDNFASGVMDRLGLGPAAQRELNPGIVSLTMPAFGSDGPLAQLRAYGTTVEQSCGLPFANRPPGGPPALHHVALGDPIAGMFGALALLAGLHARRRGVPAQVELTQVECLFQVAASAIVGDQSSPGPTAVRRDRSPVVPVDRGADRWALVAETARTSVEVPIQRPDELGHDPQHAATALWGTLDRRYVGYHSHARQPFRFDGERLPLRTPAPLLGEHTDAVLGELDGPAGHDVRA
ncbi:MAG: CoA transferase [Desertimonas sp.]